MLLIFCLLLTIYSNFFALDRACSILANRCMCGFFNRSGGKFLSEIIFSDKSAYLFKAEIQIHLNKQQYNLSAGNLRGN